MPHTTNTDSNPPHRGRFKEIASVVDEESGLVASITERESDGQISFCVFREFEKTVDGVSRTERSTFMRPRHIPALHRILKELDRRLEGIEDRTRAAKRRTAVG